jgi:HEAT repeat protein
MSVSQELRDLVAILRTGSRSEKIQAFQKIGLMGKKGDAAIPELLRLSRSKTPAYRAMAAECLGNVAIRPSRVLPALLKLMADRYAGVRCPAGNSVGLMGCPRIALPHFLKALRERNSLYGRFIILQATTNLADYGPKAYKAVPLLLRRLHNADWAIRIASAGTLATIAPHDSRVLPALTRQLSREREAHMKRRFEKVIAVLTNSGR